MRKIEFRGKRTDSGKWIYGYLIQTGHENIEKSNGQYVKTIKYYQIQEENYHSQFVDENTIGQFTGLKDKNGKEIYEGDIVEWTTLSGNKYCFSVEYNNKYAQFVSVNTRDISMECEPLGDYENIIVIGNIYDNPELLEGKR